MKHLVSAVTLLLVALGGAAACGGSGDSTSGSGGTTATGTTTGTGTSTGTGAGGGGVGCDPACVAPQFCSVVQTCLDPGSCAGEGDCEAGKTCDAATSTCVIGGGCGAQEVTADAVPPNLLVVLDRSCSMTSAVGATTKWAIAVQAIDLLTTSYAGKIRFGLAMFPDLVAPSCGQDAIPIPVAPGNEAAIQSMLNAALANADPYFPDGPCVTNIDTAMQQAAGEPAFTDTTRSSYALLITDGKQAGCSAAGGDAGTTQIITDMATAGVSTFVVGFGAGVDPAQMDVFAEGGGVASAGGTKYYEASYQASLDAGLQTIAEMTLGCVFSLGDTPPDPNEIYVCFDNADAIPRDATHTNGWDYDPSTNQITFYGPACDALKSGAVGDVDIVFGCNEPTPG